MYSCRLRVVMGMKRKKVRTRTSFLLIYGQNDELPVLISQFYHQTSNRLPLFIRAYIP
jgi:hypothetical protein